VARRPQLLSLRTLVVLQLAAIAVLAVATVARFHVWAEIDERAHYVNVQSLAEDGRYPRPGDLVSGEVQAITDGTFPRPSPNDPRNQGLAGRAYEAVQTPLYYLLATPAFLLPFDHRHKVFVLRAFDVALLAVALALAAALAREVLRERWLAGYAAVLAVVLWPGVLVRMVTVSNDVLAVPVGLLFALLTWQAWTRRSPARLVAAGGAFGLVVLTKVTLLFLAPVLVLAAADALLLWDVPRARLAGGAALLLPLVLVAPALYATDPRLAGQDLAARVARLLDSSLPQEFASQYEAGGLGALVTRAMSLALVGFGAAGALVARRAVGAIPAIVLGLPLVAGVLGLIAQDQFGAADHFFGRYLYTGALLFALFGALAWTAVGRPRVVVGWAISVSLVAAAFWVHLAAAYYFLDVGRRLGLD
jgi:hypothetical protein